MKRSGSAAQLVKKEEGGGDDVALVHEEISVAEHEYDPNKKMKREKEGEEEAKAEEEEEAAATEGEKGGRGEDAGDVVLEKKRPQRPQLLQIGTKKPAFPPQPQSVPGTFGLGPPLPPPPPPPSSSATSSSSAAAQGEVSAKAPENWSAKCKALVEMVLFKSEEEARKYANSIYAGDRDL